MTTETTADDHLKEIMQRILDGIDTSVAFGKEHLPDVLQQLLTWHFVESLIWFTFALTFIAVGIGYVWFVFTRKPTLNNPDHYQRCKPDFWFDGDGDMTGTQITAFIGVMSALGGFITVTENLAWLKIWLAPKLYLLEYGAQLIK